jgi:LTXXQ motif family protein
MSMSKLRLAALLASAFTLAVAANDQASAGHGGGGGGGGGHFGGGGGFGGGHFGGGGGFGGGGMRMGGGGFGGGGMRMGGGGGHNFGGQHFNGGQHFGGGGHNFGGGTTHNFGGNLGGNHHGGPGGTHFAGGGFGPRGWGAHGWGAHGWGPHGWGPWHGAFPRYFPGFRGWYGFGWYGPVFWPFAYDVLVADIFWPWGWDYPFWGYGYPDIYGALFWPYGYDDLAGYFPPGPGAVGPGPVGPPYAQGSPAAARVAQQRAARVAARPVESRQAEATGQVAQMCGEDTKEVAGWPIDRIEQSVSPTEDQRHLLDDFANASIRASQAIKEACPTTVSFAPTGRLDAMQKRLEGMAQAINIVSPPLDKFYSSLTDEQKARLNAANGAPDTTKSLANCGAVGNSTQWPQDRVERAVRPNAEQQGKLDALKTAMADAADRLAKACPASLPATPSARLEAMSMRLDTMITSVKGVRGALDDFYNSLSDEQKAQFNLIGRQPARQSGLQ